MYVLPSFPFIVFLLIFLVSCSIGEDTMQANEQEQAYLAALERMVDSTEENRHLTGKNILLQTE